MSIGRRSSTATYAPTWKVYAGAAAVDCIAESPDGSSCASKVVLLSAGDLTVLRDDHGVNRPITGAPAGYVHDADVSAVTGSVGFVVFWGKC